ncbi:hypothetical protein HK102_011061, partial [Quaeritorhiza haematococci]
VCGRAFKRPQDLKKHEKLHAPGEDNGLRQIAQPRTRKGGVIKATGIGGVGVGVGAMNGVPSVVPLPGQLPGLSAYPSNTQPLATSQLHPSASPPMPLPVSNHLLNPSSVHVVPSSQITHQQHQAILSPQQVAATAGHLLNSYPVSSSTVVPLPATSTTVSPVLSQQTAASFMPYTPLSPDTGSDYGSESVPALSPYSAASDFSPVPSPSLERIHSSGISTSATLAAMEPPVTSALGIFDALDYRTTVPHAPVPTLSTGQQKRGYDVLDTFVTDVKKKRLTASYDEVMAQRLDELAMALLDEGPTGFNVTESQDLQDLNAFLTQLSAEIDDVTGVGLPTSYAATPMVPMSMPLGATMATVAATNANHLAVYNNNAL